MASDSKQRITFRTPDRAGQYAPESTTPPPAESSSLRQARHTAARLHAVEQELARRIIENYQVDRQLRRLLVEMHICSSRVRAQLEDCETGGDGAERELCSAVINDRRPRR